MPLQDRDDVNTLRTVAYLISQYERVDWEIAERLVSLGWLEPDLSPSGYVLTDEGKLRQQT